MFHEVGCSACRHLFADRARLKQSPCRNGRGRSCLDYPVRLGPNDLKIGDDCNAQSRHFVEFHQSLRVQPQRWFVLAYRHVDGGRFDAVDAHILVVRILDGTCGPSSQV